MHYTSLATAKERFEKMLGESESSLPLAHQSYLAVIVLSSQVGCCHIRLQIPVESGSAELP
jgi:hypothetical protein